MQKDRERETECLRRLLRLEDLAEKKAKIYSRLLTDTALAKEMEGLAHRHEERAECLKASLGETGVRREKA